MYPYVFVSALGSNEMGRQKKSIIIIKIIINQEAPVDPVLSFRSSMDLFPQLSADRSHTTATDSVSVTVVVSLCVSHQLLCHCVSATNVV